MTIEKIIQGFLHFRRHVRPSLAPLFTRLAEGQSPGVLLFACSDSRVVPNRIASSEPGDVFEVRTVGNLVAPATSTGVSIGDLSEAAAVEYAVGVLGVRDVIVMGHSRCGAMKAVLERSGSLDSAPNLCSWLAHAEHSREKLGELTFDPGVNDVDRLSQANVLAQLAHVATYPIVESAVRRGDLDLHGAWLDVATGDLFLHDGALRSFVLLDEVEGQRRLDTFARERIDPA